MVLESTIICVDNSEYARNGDTNPTRLWAQRDAANFIARNKVRDNPENEVGIISMADNFVRCSLTSEIGKLNTVLSQIQPDGQINLNTSIRVAQLALKHRMNKNQRQRVVIFLCSPIESDGNELIRTAKRLKKEKVNVDIISFGETEFNQMRLEGLHKVFNPEDSTLTRVEPDGLTEALKNLKTLAISSPVSNPVVTESNDFGVPDQIDEELDPELALALRISLEEERARQEKELQKEAKLAEDDDKVAELSSRNKDNLTSIHTEEMSHELAEIMLNNVGLFARRASAAEKESVVDQSDDAELQEAIRMSMGQEAEIDENTLQEILESLPGVDSSEVKKNMSKDDAK